MHLPVRWAGRLLCSRLSHARAWGHTEGGRRRFEAGYNRADFEERQAFSMSAWLSTANVEDAAQGLQVGQDIPAPLCSCSVGLFARFLHRGRMHATES